MSIINSLISIIITNYNYEQYLSEAIESVLAQTYQNFEIIIVDDGSTDQSAKIIKKYEALYPEKVKVILKENGGQGSAFNSGFEIAQGDIIAFLDADDYWYENKLETIAKYHQDYDGIQHNLLINNKVKFTILEDKVAKQKKGFEKFGFLGTIPTSGLSFKSNLLEKVFPIPESDYKICADLYVKNLFLNYHDIFSIDDPLGCYRSHGKNLWFSSQHSSIKYNQITLEKINQIRINEGKHPVPKSNEAESIGRYMLDRLKLNKSERYVIYGTGNLGEVFYRELQPHYNIAFFSNSFAKQDGEKFLNKEIKTLDYLKENTNEYDKIIIASSQLSEITQLLLEKGFEKNDLIILGL